MDERWNTHVRTILDVLVEILLPLALIDRLHAVFLINREEYEKIKAYDNAEGSRQLLVSILPKKGPDSFERFLTVLKKTEGQEHVAKEIMKDRPVYEEDATLVRNRERTITLLERKLEIERKEREKERLLFKREKNETEEKVKELQKEKVTNVELRNKIGPSMGSCLKWEARKPNMPVDLWPSGCVAEINGILHVGWEDRMFQLKKKAWEGENHHLGFGIGSVFECEGKGYVMRGGGSTSMHCVSIYEWKSETRKLEPLTEVPLQHQPLRRSAIGHNGIIYLVGGVTSDKVDIFHISKRKWEIGNKMKNKRYACSLAVIDDKLFVGGGCGARNSVECFFTKEEMWIDIKLTTKEMCQLSLWNGKLVATGGEDKKWSNCVELYDEVSGDWLPLPSMIKGRHWHGACTTKDNELIVVGGGGVFGGLDSVECLKM